MKAIADIKLAPSILAADFTRLGDQVAEAERAGADRIHVDIMDGHFVPNISMGAPVVQSLRKVTSLRLEIHMMITDHLHRTVQRVKALQKQVGVAINPATPAFVLEEILPDLDQVLVMTVNPGFGHQPFIYTTLPKIKRVSRMIGQLKRGCELEVDGGIDEATAQLTVEAGANVLVAGSSIFGANVGVCAAMQRLRGGLRSNLDRVSTGSGSDLVRPWSQEPGTDQVATAPCTDPIQEQRFDFTKERLCS